MSHSLGEIEALCKKAARGAGLSWGEAEEAAQSVRLLAASRIDPLAAYTDCLTAISTGHISADLCPLRLGCRLLDRELYGADLGSFEARFPLLLLPYLARASLSAQQAFALNGTGFQARVGPDLCIEVGQTCDHAKDLSVTTIATGPQVHRVYRLSAAPDALAPLNRLADRTYAPETQERREAGAGAGDDGNS